MANRKDFVDDMAGETAGGEPPTEAEDAAAQRAVFDSQPDNTVAPKDDDDAYEWVPGPVVLSADPVVAAEQLMEAQSAEQRAYKKYIKYASKHAQTLRELSDTYDKAHDITMKLVGQLGGGRR